MDYFGDPIIFNSPLLGTFTAQSKHPAAAGNNCGTCDML